MDRIPDWYAVLSIVTVASVSWLAGYWKGVKDTINEWRMRRNSGDDKSCP